MMQDIGVERYNLQQREKMQILSHLLANYNDGRRKLSKNNVHIQLMYFKKIDDRRNIKLKLVKKQFVNLEIEKRQKIGNQKADNR